jgi:hypothetical protein
VLLTLCHIELNVPEAIDSPPALTGSWLLQSISPFRERRIIASLGAPKHPNLGRLVTGIAPRQDGTFLIEIGAVLSDHLPNMHGQHEYSLSIPATVSHAARVLHFSNQLSRIRWLRNGDPLQVICPLYRLHEVHAGRLAAPADAHVEYLRTSVTARYDLAGSDPEDALSNHIDDALADFISCINHVVGAHLMVAQEAWGILTPTYDQGSFEYVYLLVSGSDPKIVIADRLAVSALRVGLGSPTYTEPDESTFRSLVSGTREADDTVRLLRSAKSYIEGGVLHLALVQLAITAELATTRYVTHEYSRRQMSKKLPQFGVMLNREIGLLAPPGNPPDPQLLDRIDHIRKLRNELMHSAKFESSVNDLRKMHGAVKLYASYLQSIHTGAP